MTIRTFVTTIVAAVLVACAVTAAKADVYFLESNDQHETDTTAATHVSDSADDRLLIVNGQTGRVIYDDGKNDLFCVTRKVVIGYNEFGKPIRKRVMRCR
ncbi:hypothetical protein [Bradyrhizobium cenepequi]